MSASRSPVFKTGARPFWRTLRKKLAGAFGIEPKAADLETVVLPFTPCSSISIQDACGRTRTYVVRGRLIYSQVLLLLGHARLKKLFWKKRGLASV